MRSLILLMALCAACSGSSTAPSPSPAPAPIVQPAPIVPTPAPLPTRGPLFDQTFWNEFVHDTFEQPSAPIALRRLTSAPMLYLKTVDEAGNSIDAVTLQTVEDAARSVAITWGGGQFGLAGIQRGTGTMEGRSGWVTVTWPNPSLGATLCGRVSGIGGGVGVDAGTIELNYRNTACACNGSTIRPRTVRHELGHVFGYWHTDSDRDLMFSTSNSCADTFPSAREVYHAQLAYQTPVGSTTALPRSPLVIVD